jgi:hypothetical protein
MAAKKKSPTKKKSSAAKTPTPKAKPKAARKPKPKAARKAKPKAARKAKPKAARKPKPKAAAATKVTVGRVDKSAGSRRDGSGHLPKKYARDLREISRESRGDRNDTRAFLRRSRSEDDLAEELGEEAVAAMNSGEGQGDRLTDLEVEEETGGPFVETSARTEFARGTDRSNPRKATREPFPTS